MRSIKTKLTVFFGLIIGIVCIGLGIVSVISSLNGLKSNLNKTLPRIAEQTASNIQGRIEGELNSLEAIAARPDINNPNSLLQDKLSILLGEVKRIGCSRLSYIDKEGNLTNTLGATSNVKDREYFKKAMNGVSSVSDPLINKTDGTLLVIYAVPIKYNNEIVGVLAESQDGNDLSDLTDQVKFGQTGASFMINNSGVVIAHKNRDLVTQMYNGIEAAEKDANLQGLANIERKMISGETGLGEYQYEGVDKFVSYAPVKETNWSVGVTITKNEILSELSTLEISVAISSIVFILIGLGIIYIISNSISKGIRSTSKHLKSLAEGNLCEEVSTRYLNSKDEIGVMTNAMKSMQESLGTMIKK